MNIAEILKDYPRGTSLYSSTFGELRLWYVLSCSLYPIYCKVISSGSIVSFAEDGKRNITDAEPTLFPSKEQRDWSEFNMNTKVNDEETECQLKQSENVLVYNDIEQNYKRIPFNVELAKKIVNGKVKGRIVTMEGRKVRIVCWDKKPIDERAMDFPIVALLQNDCEGEMLNTYTKEGLASSPNYKNRYNLIIEIPNYKDYSNFEPKKYQPCLVRNGEDCLWGIQVYSHTDYQGKKLFYDGCYLRQFTNVLPLSEVTKRLICTKKSYEELIDKLEGNDQD